MVASNTTVTSLKIPVSRGTEKQERKNISLTTDELRAQSHGQTTWKHLVWAPHDIIIFQARSYFLYFGSLFPIFLVILNDPIKIGLIKTLVIYAFYYLSNKLRSLLFPKLKLTEMISRSYRKLLKREMKMQSHGNTTFLFS